MDVFEEYADKIKNTKPNMDKEQGEQIYGLFKQANVGDCNIADPGTGDAMAKQKFDAWTAQAGKSKEDAAAEYVELAKTLLGE